ncbi:helix-turn-helix transcriptional regulator [Winogradskyella immobilis]|uniref:Helix-turn-helix transcriptional regulator n=1 Tax=Winogradskyella immobilis TaxID=2816852 RepID=A0ABS8EQA7_9FLAO|nr:AraC family transcriptional regulator [Winogradskyella immobilis]MCC1485419.1 helix-turn-helix transcriptional regulator [Winogradskyella immobilis]MCG0017511.1 AraC family transcriptional regulator [Winogradskyella immobilis]
MHVKKTKPEINKVYQIKKHTLIHILSGTGGIQVDFKNYFDWQEKGIFLEYGQYIKFLSDDFVIRKYEFHDEDQFYNNEVRVLFKHLISLGYINLEECNECKSFLYEQTSEEPKSIIDVSSKQWYWQNPFKANKEEYQIIFDTKEIIDREFSNSLTTKDLVDLINQRGYNAQSLIKDKIGLSVKNLMSSKRLIESKREIAFTDKTVQEISYELGYKDDAYFNRVFKNTTGQTPKQFRDNFDFKNRDLFTQDIVALLKEHHTQERSLEFYADKMNLSIKTLGKKVQAKMNTSLGQLIRLELINTAKLMLIEGESITQISRNLGFEEPNHFSSFFKHYSGITPTEFKTKKHN